MTGHLGRTRVTCPLCGVDVSLSHLRYLHVCGKSGGRSKMSLEACKDKAEKALVARMLRLNIQARQERAPVQDVRADSPLYTEYNG